MLRGGCSLSGGVAERARGAERGAGRGGVGGVPLAERSGAGFAAVRELFSTYVACRKVAPHSLSLCSAAALVSQAVELLSRLGPARDTLPLFLEALQLGSEGDAPAFRAALMRGTHTLLTRQPKRTFAAALDALPQILAVAGEAAAALADERGDGADAHRALEAALDVASLLCVFATDDVTRARARHALLQVLCAAASLLPLGAAEARLAPLRASLATLGITTWDALRDATAPMAHDPGCEEDEVTPASAVPEGVTLGAALLAHAWVCGDAGDGPEPGGAEALRTTATHALALLPHPSRLALLGAQMVSSASRRVTLCSDEAALNGVLLALAEAMAHSPLPLVRTASYTALLACLDAHAPFARLAALRALLKCVRDPGVSALLFRRLKDDAAAGWGQPPFGSAPCARLLVEWMAEGARGGEDALGDCADAAVGCLNALRFMLLRDAADGSNCSGLRSRAALRELVEGSLEPLALASGRAAAATLEGLEGTPAPLLALQTLHEVATRTLEAARAASTGLPEADGPPQNKAVLAVGAPGGLRRGFLC